MFEDSDEKIEIDYIRQVENALKSAIMTHVHNHNCIKQVDSTNKRST
jgi:hypothetical protein